MGKITEKLLAELTNGRDNRPFGIGFLMNGKSDAKDTFAYATGYGMDMELQGYHGHHLQDIRQEMETLIIWIMHTSRQYPDPSIATKRYITPNRLVVTAT